MHTCCSSSNQAEISAMRHASAPPHHCMPFVLPSVQGDPTYLVVNSEGKLENYGVNAVCTHLGCVVPWNVVGGCLSGCTGCVG